MVHNLYFYWLCGLISQVGLESRLNLIRYLHTLTFTYLIEMDRNRVGDAVSLRFRFALEKDISYDEIEAAFPFEECSVLEMMVGLAFRCEENLMTDYQKGNRTGEWFSYMLKSLGLYSMTDDAFDEDSARHIVNVFLCRDYCPDGLGGLFYIENSTVDLRDVEIWRQAMLYFTKLIYLR